MEAHGDASQQTAHECCATCGRPFDFGQGDAPRMEGTSLVYGKHRVPLTATERAIMRPLLRAFGSVVHTERLYTAAFGERDIDLHRNMTVKATHIRGKLYGSGLWLENERGIGYRLVSDHNFDHKVER